MNAGIRKLLESIPTLALYGPLREPNYVVGPGPDTPVIVGGVLEIIVALAGISTAVVLFPVLKTQIGDHSGNLIVDGMARWFGKWRETGSAKELVFIKPTRRLFGG